MTHLSIEHLSIAYQRQVVLRDVSLSAGGGELLGLIGPNGAGKSTLLRTIAGSLAPMTGSVRLDGADLTHMDTIERARQVAVVPQGAHLPEAFGVAEVVLMGRNPHLSRFGGERARDY